MMQPATGVVPPPMPPNQQQQPQYQQPPPPQQWMMMPPPQQQPPQQQPLQPQPPPAWAQQHPQAVVPPPQQPQQQLAPTQTQTTNSDEIRSLWIGDLQYWMDENYLYTCLSQTGELASVKVIRNKQTGQAEGYGFLEFTTRAAAERILQAYNGTPMPNSEQNFRLNWATLGAGERHADDTPDYTIFVGDLAADVSDYMLQETFRAHYSSVKGAKVVTDRITGRSKGYGFVRFGDESEQTRAMTEMNGVPCSTRPIRKLPTRILKETRARLIQTIQQYLLVVWTPMFQMTT
uniref:Putative polyadenylate-binding protein RBP45 n=1 Tax=Davidia involucrata TaxID=16924 RepID=A0A5B6ZDJ3_DAVIN